MKRTLPIILLILSGCMAHWQPVKFQEGQAKPAYYEFIKDWQERIKREGWTQGMVDEVVSTCVRISKYTTEPADQWATPKQFLDANCEGDCEDIAALIFFSLEQLKYPYPHRILIVKTLMGDHALIRLQRLDGQWQMYQTVPAPLWQLDAAFYRPMCEFDGQEIYR